MKLSIVSDVVKINKDIWSKVSENYWVKETKYSEQNLLQSLKNAKNDSRDQNFETHYLITFVKNDN